MGWRSTAFEDAQTHEDNMHAEVKKRCRRRKLQEGRTDQKNDALLDTKWPLMVMMMNLLTVEFHFIIDLNPIF